jgi:hypothetical protein
VFALAVSGNQPQEIILVLCHSFFYEAFSIIRPLNEDVYKSWMSSRFIANFIIERQAELSEGVMFAGTSKQVFDNFSHKFLGQKPSLKQRETVNILRNSIYVVDHPYTNKLSLDESVFVICDIVYSSSNSMPILVSNIPAKQEKAEAFYQKKNPEAKIPFPILNPAYTEAFLKDKFPTICKSVEERIRLGSQ